MFLCSTIDTVQGHVFLWIRKLRQHGPIKQNRSFLQIEHTGASMYSRNNRYKETLRIQLLRKEFE